MLPHCYPVGCAACSRCLSCKCGIWAIALTIASLDLLACDDPSATPSADGCPSSNSTLVTTLTLDGFTEDDLNAIYIERTDAEWRVHGQKTYWAQNGQFFIYRCNESWMVAYQVHFEQSVQGDCTGRAYTDYVLCQALQDSKGGDWFEYVNYRWEAAKNAGIVSIGTSQWESIIVYGNGYDSRRAHPHCSFPIFVQGHCDNCWAEALVGTASDAYCLWNGEDIQLDTQFLMSCSGIGDACCGDCLGGVPIGCSYQEMSDLHMAALRYIRDHGLPQRGERLPPYVTCSCSTDLDLNGCKQCLDAAPYFKSPGAFSLGNDHDSRIKEWIQAAGSVTACLHIADSFTSHFYEGIYMHAGNPYDTNHCVRLVGWGSTNVHAYWIAANSWGRGWNEGGFFRVSHHTAGLSMNRAAWPSHDLLAYMIFAPGTLNISPTSEIELSRRANCHLPGIGASLPNPTANPLMQLPNDSLVELCSSFNSSEVSALNRILMQESVPDIFENRKTGCAKGKQFGSPWSHMEGRLSGVCVLFVAICAVSFVWMRMYSWCTVRVAPLQDRLLPTRLIET